MGPIVSTMQKCWLTQLEFNLSSNNSNKHRTCWKLDSRLWTSKRMSQPNKIKSELGCSRHLEVTTEWRLLNADKSAITIEKRVRSACLMLCNWPKLHKVISILSLDPSWWPWETFTSIKKISRSPKKHTKSNNFSMKSSDHQAIYRGKKVEHWGGRMPNFFGKFWEMFTVIREGNQALWWGHRCFSEGLWQRS